jgi:agmatine/peptidylarginine deiminase
MRKKLILISFLISFIFIGPNFITAQQITYKSNVYISEVDRIWFDKNPDSLPIWLTQDEIQRIYEIGKGFKATSPPSEPVRMPAEFEPMQGVLIRYQFGISYQIIKEMAEEVEVVTIVANEGEKNTVISQYQSYGIDLDNCDFLIASTDSYWTRDYGPWFIFNGDNEQGIVDFIYNRPRPNDDKIPTKYGDWQDIPVYAMSLVSAGGNFMTDGQGIAVSTDLVWSENSGYTHTQISQMMHDYCGIDNYHVVPDVLGEYIKHIDCWGKYLSPDTIMIIKKSSADPDYKNIEYAVEYFENQTSCYGTPYKIARVYVNYQEPYINSLILNKKVFIPVQGSQWDDEAIESYQSALPGYEVLGFTGSWVSTDALHCRAMGITDRYMLYIKHIPLTGIQYTKDGYDIEVKIFPYSGENLIDSSTGVYWRMEDSDWNFIQMEQLGNNYYHAVIPPQENNTKVYYYIHAEDESGRSENHPYIGAPMAYSFTTYSDNNPPEKPTITGPMNGKIGKECTYCLSPIVDPDGDNLYVFWDWGDGETSSWLGPFASGQEICESHSWDIKGTYIIKAKLKDEYGAESSWGELTVTMPRYIVINIMFYKFLEKFPMMEQILKIK